MRASYWPPKIHNNGGDHGFYFHTEPKPVGGRAARDPRRRARDALWSLVSRAFRDPEARRQMAWERHDAIWTSDWPAGDLAPLAARYVRAVRIPSMTQEAKTLAAAVETPADLQKVRDLYYRAMRVEEASATVKHFSFKALRLAIDDLTHTFPERYTRGGDYLRRLGLRRGRCV